MLGIVFGAFVSTVISVLGYRTVVLGTLTMCKVSASPRSIQNCNDALHYCEST